MALSQTPAAPDATCLAAVVAALEGDAPMLDLAQLLDHAAAAADAAAGAGVGDAWWGAALAAAPDAPRCLGFVCANALHDDVLARRAGRSRGGMRESLALEVGPLALVSPGPTHTPPHSSLTPFPAPLPRWTPWRARPAGRGPPCGARAAPTGQATCSNARPPTPRDGVEPNG